MTVLELLLLVWLVSVLGVIVFASRDAARRSDTIVVLGAAQYDGRPSPVLRARVDHAMDLWRSRVAPVLIFTGGVGEGDTTSEAAVSEAYALRRGIPPAVILTEPEGRTSLESMRAVAGMLAARRLRSAVLVSDPFHMFRLWILARRLGIQAYTSPTHTSPISPNRAMRWRYILGESVKVPFTLLFETLIPDRPHG